MMVNKFHIIPIMTRMNIVIERDEHWVCMGCMIYGVIKNMELVEVLSKSGWLLRLSDTATHVMRILAPWYVYVGISYELNGSFARSHHACGLIPFAWSIWRRILAGAFTYGVMKRLDV